MTETEQRLTFLWAFLRNIYGEKFIIEWVNFKQTGKLEGPSPK